MKTPWTYSNSPDPRAGLAAILTWGILWGVPLDAQELVAPGKGPSLREIFFAAGAGQEHQTGDRLRALADRDFLNLVEQAAAEKPSLLFSESLLSHMKARWKDRPPVAEIIPGVRDRKKGPVYRQFLSDYLVWSVRKRTRGPVLNRSQGIIDGKRLVTDYRRIIADREDSRDMRFHATSRAATLLGVLRETDALSSPERQEVGDFFVGKLLDAAEDQGVRGRSAKALRCLDDRRALPHLRRIIGDVKSPHTFLTRSAVLAVAKMKDLEAIAPVSRLLEETESSAVFRTSVYALGLYGDPSTLRKVLRYRQRFEPETTRALLRGSRETVEGVFRRGDRSHLLDAIEVVRFAALKSLKEHILPLVTDPDVEIRRASIEALLKVGDREDLSRILNRTTDERAPAVRSVIREVRSELARVYHRGEPSRETSVIEEGGAR